MYIFQSIQGGPERPFQKLYSSYESLITFQLSGNDREKILKLNNIDIKFIGYYYCVEIDSIDETIENALKNNKTSRIYLYVKGETPFAIKIDIYFT